MAYYLQVENEDTGLCRASLSWTMPCSLLDLVRQWNYPPCNNRGRSFGRASCMVYVGGFGKNVIEEYLRMLSDHL